MEILLQKKISLNVEHLYPYDRYEATIIIYRKRVHELLRRFYKGGYRYGYQILDNRLDRKYLIDSERDFNSFCYSKYTELRIYCEGLIEEYKKGIRVVEPLRFADESYLQ